MNPKAVLTIGILVLLLPYLGFPQDWDTAFYTILGAILILMSLAALWRRYLTESLRESREEKNVTHREHDPENADNGGASSSSVGL